MKTKQIDAIIKTGKPVKVHDARFNDTFTIEIVSRDKNKSIITTKCGARIDGSRIEVIK